MFISFWILSIFKLLSTASLEIELPISKRTESNKEFIWLLILLETACWWKVLFFLPTLIPLPKPEESSNPEAAAATLSIFKYFIAN